MNRSSFVVGYVSKKPQGDLLLCLACDISNKHTHGMCGGMACTHERFNNTIHIPMVTQKECLWNSCPSRQCDRCVMHLKFGVKQR